MKLKSVLLLALLPLCSCMGPENPDVVSRVDTITVASRVAHVRHVGIGSSFHDGPCTDDCPATDCLWIRQPSFVKGWFTILGIDGFEFEAGYEYRVRVQATHDNRLADYPDYYQYKCLNVLSKEKKQTEGLPEQHL